MRCALAASLFGVFAFAAGCGSSSAPPEDGGGPLDAAPTGTGVTLGCVPGEASGMTLADLCADTDITVGQRVTLAGPFDAWKVPAYGDSACSLVGCAPGVCCNECAAMVRLSCPGSDRVVKLGAASNIELPTIEGYCYSECAFNTTSFGCVGAAGPEWSSACESHWQCTPAANTICSAGGVVMVAKASAIWLEVDSLDLTVSP